MDNPYVNQKMTALEPKGANQKVTDTKTEEQQKILSKPVKNIQSLTADKQSSPKRLIEKISPPPEKIEKEQVVANIQKELSTYKSAILASDVREISDAKNVPVEYLMAFMKNDSHYGTRGK